MAYCVFFMYPARVLINNETNYLISTCFYNTLVCTMYVSTMYVCTMYVQCMYNTFLSNFFSLESLTGLLQITITVFTIA